MPAAGCTAIGGGVGVGVGEGAGVVEVPGNGDAPGSGGIAEAVALGEGWGVTGALVAAGAGGFTWARGTAPDAIMHPAKSAAPNNQPCRFNASGYFGFVSAHR